MSLYRGPSCLTLSRPYRHPLRQLQVTVSSWLLLTGRVSLCQIEVWLFAKSDLLTADEISQQWGDTGIYLSNTFEITGSRQIIVCHRRIHSRLANRNYIGHFP